MIRDLRGEMTSLHAPIFSHPDEDIPNVTVQQATFTALAWAISTGDADTVETMLEGQAGGRLLVFEDYVRVPLSTHPTPPSSHIAMILTYAI